MIAEEMINNMVPSLKLTDLVSDALSWMDEFRVCHLPVVFEDEYLGLVSENQLYELPDENEAIGSYKINFKRPLVFGNQHIFDVVKTIGENKLTTIPIVGKEEQYLGLTTSVDLIEHLTRLASFHEQGGIIILTMNVHDYSLAEIARIVESNDAKILSSHVASSFDSSQVELVLKLNKTDLTRIIASFERFNYTIKESYHESDHDDDLQDRYDMLMNFLKF